LTNETPWQRSILGKVPQTGARSTSEFWNEYAQRYRPALTEEVVLCERESEAKQIITHLLGKPGPLVFVADGPDEVSAVAVAAIRKAEPDSRAFLEARTLIIDTDDAGRALGMAGSYAFIVSPAANKISGYLAGFAPTISGVGFDAAGQRYPRLVRPSTQAMKTALLTTGMTEDEASRLAIKSGRSLTILERHAPAASFEPPAWVADGGHLVPALLAGGWDSRHEGDQTIVAELGGADYSAIEARLRGFLNRRDAPIEREGGIWKLRAPVDAFMNLARFVGPEHLRLVESVASKVFAGAPPPKIHEERFGVSAAPYSSWLRDGLANTLLMFAVLSAEVGLEAGGEDPSRFVDRLVGGFPGLGDDYRMIMSLERQLPVLMEAAPDQLLSSLEQLLEGDREKIRPIFGEASDFGVPQSNLPNLLWALETLAWDPARLPRISLVLAKLAEIDPGGRSGNRPINSLRSIFLAWLPSTNATLATRLLALDAITTRFPTVGWNLICQLLPKGHDTTSSTRRPRFREAGGSAREVVTHRLVYETYEAITDRAFSMVGDELPRWLALIDAFPRLSPDRRAQFLDMLTVWTGGLPGEVKAEVRSALARIAARHARFREADWALPDLDFRRLQVIITSLESRDPVEQVRLLFDEWMPYSGSDYAEAEARISQERRRAIIGFANKGTQPILALVEKVRSPRLVADVIAEAIHDNTLLTALIGEAAARDAPAQQFAEALAGALRWRHGEEFADQFIAMARQFGWSGDQAASLMLSWPEVPPTWRLVERFGKDAAALFWSRREPRSFDGSAAELSELVQYYLSVGGPAPPWR
jgi:hypothetical protein